jgi:hypothetical protein
MTPAAPLKDIALAIGSISGTIGTIVVVFLVFATTQLREILSDRDLTAQKTKLFTAESVILEASSTTSIVTLLLNCILTIVSLLFPILDLSFLIIVFFILFTIGILCLLGPILLLILWNLRVSQSIMRM